MKTFNCNFEIIESQRRQPNFLFNEKDLNDIDLSKNTCIFSTSGAGYSYIIDFLYQYIRAKNKNTKIVITSNLSSFILDYWIRKDENVEYCDFEYEKLLASYKSKAIVISIFLNIKEFLNYKKYELSNVANLILANSENKIFSFVNEKLKSDILDFYADNLLKDIATFKSLNSENELAFINTIKDGFTFKFLIESKKTSILSVFKGKKI
ncbi:hypothetical protein CSUB8523_0649 [Campylobacter subantarcticus LMG 24377]|uniref:Uncharacterized protein n=1 Tax=Campylobacter subantarcticus TaxID=497724 RepID=A0ABW9N341_9BACT|nr:hypothetical protein [Campylobacter subantarcticus]AJC92175.1 hypothetical protein CSUB8523_0649 [Campylobacter subantarcticus LMG 24377]EAL3938394.1 hypothetical protein [Campylobacter lari]MPB98676.1 hypothetical protein [Campylobacter subantarcticus]